ncbi:MAG TPA: hypothetical protein VL119_03635, partial [Acidimicrobiia bacterium]|nr:hypothetical protein [Acidimicrobiia bacterium]
MRVPTTLQRIRAARGAIGLAAPRAAAPSAREIAARVVRDLPSDTLLPGAFSRPDSLLPRATRATAAPAPATARPGRARPVGAPPTGPDEITTRRAGRRGVARVQFR